MDSSENIEIQRSEQIFEMQKLILDCPIPLPLEIIDELPDWNNIDFMVADSNSNLIVDEAGFLFESTNGILKPANVHTDNFQFFGIYTSPANDGKDIVVEFSSKFTNGKMENINILFFNISDASVRISAAENWISEIQKNDNKWFNKYIFNTRWYHFVVIESITVIKNLVDKLYIRIVERPNRPPRSGCGCSGR